MEHKNWIDLQKGIDWNIEFCDQHGLHPVNILIPIRYTKFLPVLKFKYKGLPVYITDTPCVDLSTVTSRKVIIKKHYQIKRIAKFIFSPLMCYLGWLVTKVNFSFLWECRMYKLIDLVLNEWGDELAKTN